MFKLARYFAGKRKDQHVVRIVSGMIYWHFCLVFCVSVYLFVLRR